MNEEPELKRCDRCGEPIRMTRWYYADEVAEIVEYEDEKGEQPHLLIHVGCMKPTDLLA